MYSNIMVAPSKGELIPQHSIDAMLVYGKGGKSKEDQIAFMLHKLGLRLSEALFAAHECWIPLLNGGTDKKAKHRGRGRMSTPRTPVGFGLKRIIPLSRSMNVSATCAKQTTTHI